MLSLPTTEIQTFLENRWLSLWINVQCCMAIAGVESVGVWRVRMERGFRAGKAESMAGCYSVSLLKADSTAKDSGSIIRCWQHKKRSS